MKIHEKQCWKYDQKRSIIQVECSDANQRHKRNDNVLSWVFIFTDQFSSRSLQLLLANYQYQIRITNNFILSYRIIGQYNTIVF